MKRAAKLTAKLHDLMIQQDFNVAEYERFWKSAKVYESQERM
jgi:hypothetical protein